MVGVFEKIEALGGVRALLLLIFDFFAKFRALISLFYSS